MTTIYYIDGYDLKKTVNASNWEKINSVCREHYCLFGTLPEVFDSEGTIYWAENHTALHSTRFKTNFPNYKYKKIELIDIFTKIKSNEDRLQKQETHVVRGDDTEGNRVQSRKRKASITVGHLSYKTIKS